MTRVLFATTVSATLRAFLRPLAKACRDQGWQVDALSAGAADDPDLRGHFDRIFNATWSRSPLSLSNLRAERQCRRLLAEGKYDLIHVHTPVAAFVLRLAAARSGFSGRVVYTAHGFHFTETGGLPANLLYLTLERLAARRTDRLIVINQEDHDAALRHRLLPTHDVVHLDGVGIDTHRFSSGAVSHGERAALRQMLNLDGRRVVTMVAEFNPGKRHVDLIDALPEVLKTDSSIVFLLAGSGRLFAETKAQAESLGVAGHVRFLGQWKEMPALLSISELVVLPSLREGLPVSLMEAMAMEVPFVGTDIRGIRDLASGGCGLLVPPRSPMALAKAIIELLSEPVRGREMGISARQKTVQKYDQRLIVQQQLEVYDTLLSEETPSWRLRSGRPPHNTDSEQASKSS